MADRINCPICDSDDFKILLRKDMLSAIYTLVRCRECSLVFVNPLPSPAELDAYYNGEYKVPLYQQKKVIEKGNKALSLLDLPGKNEERRLFDLGASHGYFLNEARQRGFIPFGVEPSKKACENAKKLFDLDIEDGYFEESSIRRKHDYFDVVTMFDVIEHLSDPNPILKGFREILKDGGKVVITTPNIDSTSFALFGRHWEWCTPPAHLFYYSPESIRRLFEKYGFEITHLETYRGDSAGNLFFQFFLSSRQAVFYSMKYILGRKKLLRMKTGIAKGMDESNDTAGSQYTGLSEKVSRFSERLNPLFRKSELKKNKKGHGDSLLVIAKKKVTAGI